MARPRAARWRTHSAERCGALSARDSATVAMRWRVASYGAGDEAAGPLADAEAGAGGRGVSRGVAIGDVSNAVGDADARPLALDAGSAPHGPCCGLSCMLTLAG